MRHTGAAQLHCGIEELPGHNSAELGPAWIGQRQRQWQQVQRALHSQPPLGALAWVRRGLAGLWGWHAVKQTNHQVHWHSLLHQRSP